MPIDEKAVVAEYNLAYEYDQGGNRTEKIDLENNRRVSYSYDIADPGTYESDNNRLAYAETSVNSTSALLHTTWYYYNDAGNARYVVTDEDFGGMMMMSFGGGENPCVDPLECGEGETLHTATRLEYARNNQTLVYAIGEAWCWDGSQATVQKARVRFAREFRYDGGRQRYMNRKWTFTPSDPATSCWAGSFWIAPGDTTGTGPTSIGTWTICRSRSGRRCRRCAGSRRASGGSIRGRRTARV